jgi:hypothetical protein
MLHQDIDRRSLALHSAVAQKIRRQPELLQKAVSFLNRWEQDGPSHSAYYLEAWKKIISDGVETTLAALIDPSEQATALRQASPFAGVLTPQERMEILRAWCNEKT